MSKSILVIDDEDMIRKLYVNALDGTDCQVETAESGEKGIEKAQETKFDLIFLDLKMPGLNGIETLRKLREIGQTALIYIVTGFYDEYKDQLQSAAADGMSFELLKKPFDVDTICSIVGVA